jgi:hypothetical protein
MIETLEAAQAKKKAKKRPNRRKFKHHRKGWTHVNYELDGDLWSLNAPVAVVGAARRALARVTGGVGVGDE